MVALNITKRGNKKESSVKSVGLPDGYREKSRPKRFRRRRGRKRILQHVRRLVRPSFLISRGGVAASK